MSWQCLFFIVHKHLCQESRLHSEEVDPENSYKECNFFYCCRIAVVLTEQEECTYVPSVVCWCLRHGGSLSTVFVSAPAGGVVIRFVYTHASSNRTSYSVSLRRVLHASVLFVRIFWCWYSETLSTLHTTWTLWWGWYRWVNSFRKEPLTSTTMPVLPGMFHWPCNELALHYSTVHLPSVLQSVSHSLGLGLPINDMRRTFSLCFAYIKTSLPYGPFYGHDHKWDTETAEHVPTKLQVRISNW
jgi:hypothetical protein